MGKKAPVGHIPKEVSRIKKFFIDRGVIMTMRTTKDPRWY